MIKVLYLGIPQFIFWTNAAVYERLDSEDAGVIASCPGSHETKPGRWPWSFLGFVFAKILDGFLPPGLRQSVGICTEGERVILVAHSFVCFPSEFSPWRFEREKSIGGACKPASSRVA